MNSPHCHGTHRARFRVPNPKRHGLLAAFWAAGLSLLAPSAQAVAFTSDVTISGSVSFNSSYAFTNLFGDGAQSGSISLVQGSGGTVSTFLGAVVTGGTLISGGLTDLGDGLGFTSTSSASFTGADSGFGVNVVMGLSVANNSLSDTYKVSFDVFFQNQVDASGSNAYADSLFEAQSPLGPGTLFTTRVVSDTVFGNSMGGVLLGTYGGVLSETGPAAFSFTLAPGQTVSFAPGALNATIFGEAMEAPDSTASATFTGFITVAAVENLTSPVPEPSTLAMFGVGLLGLACRRRAAR